MAVKIRFLAGPSDGAEAMLAEPLPPVIRARGPNDDDVALATGERPEVLTGDSATYHFMCQDERGAVYVAAPHRPVPPGVNWDGVEEARAPGQLFDRPL